jgi:hypothetical protein
MGAEMTTAATTNPKLMNMVYHAARGILILLALIMVAVALHPDFRFAARTTLLKEQRTIVSTAHGNLTGDGRDLTVAKIKTRDNLFVEIYESRDDGSQRLVERIELQDKRDGYFNFNGQATNLAIDDIDGDGKAEILVPSFDQSLIGHINVYHYDKTAGGFLKAMR